MNTHNIKVTAARLNMDQNADYNPELLGGYMTHVGLGPETKPGAFALVALKAFEAIKFERELSRKERSVLVETYARMFDEHLKLEKVFEIEDHAKLFVAMYTMVTIRQELSDEPRIWLLEKLKCILDVYSSYIEARKKSYA